VNYLAHCFLADITGTSIVGNLMGDVVRGPLEGRYPAEIERGIRLHRRIDSHTDTHPVVRAAKARFHPPFRRYAGILLDVFFDHFLARDWKQYHPESLEAFADRVYRAIAAEPALFGGGLRLSLDYMRSHRLLESYRETRGIRRALTGLSRRLSRTNPLAEGIGELDRCYADFEEDFGLFFPQLIEFARSEARA
jgi:acyl carrier protein phosphodiesterase